MRGLCPELVVFVDRWPLPQAVVARSRHTGMDQDVVAHMFAENEEFLVNLLQDPNTVGWNRRVLFPSHPVPEGMRTRPVSSSDSGCISSTWPFSFQGSDTYITKCAQRFPSVCLGTANGHHVGHMLGISCSALGLLYVKPEFRGQGYAKVIISHLAQKYFESGEDVYVSIAESNVTSQKVHRSLGFRRVTGSRIVWINCDSGM
ncbi:hypothetical protein ACOMHN_013852 [Nucella lapillus]